MPEYNTVALHGLWKFADFMKKSLILSLVMVLVTLFGALFGIITRSPGLILLLLAFVIISALALLVFRILQLTNLNDAKNATQNDLIRQCFTFFLIAFLADIVTAFTTDGTWLDTILSLAGYVLTVLGYWYLIKFAEQNGLGGDNLRKGFNLYLGSAVVGVVLSLISIRVGSIAILILAALISLLGIVGQFMLANAYLDAFAHTSMASPFGPPTQATVRPSAYDYPKAIGSPDTNPSMPTYIEQNRDSVPQPHAPTKFCSQCGATLPRAAKFCDKCGAPQNN